MQHLDSFIVALREELDAPGGLSAKNPPAEERKLYRIDVNPETGIESPGWYRASNDTKERNEESMVSSRLCALHWIIVLYESVVPDALKAEVSLKLTGKCLSIQKTQPHPDLAVHSQNLNKVRPRVYCPHHSSTRGKSSRKNCFQKLGSSSQNHCQGIRGGQVSAAECTGC